MSRLRLFASSALLLAACKASGAATNDDDAVPFQRVEGDYVVPPGSPLRDRITVGAVETQQIQSLLAAPATVEAEPTHMAKISPPLPGRVVKLFVHFGDAVTAATPLFSLDSPDLVAAQSDYLKAKSESAQSERNLARQKDLVDHGVAAQRELEQAQTARDTAQSELDRAGTRLRLLGLSPGAVGGPMTVTSPIAGRVIDLNTAPGQFQNDPSVPVMIVADLTSVWITASVQEKDIRRVHPNDDASVALAAYPGEPIDGKVLFVGDLLDPETRAIKVRIELPNPDMKLKSGMFATVSFKGKPVPEITVPTTAVLLHGDKSSVFGEKTPWRFERRDVDVAEQLGDKIVVTRGLDAGARVVITNAVLLQ
ncbi:efflux RND transporter periplasmic adaptor subunit [soil metagenome]